MTDLQDSKGEVYSKDPFGDTYIDLYNIDDLTKKRLNEWVKYSRDNFLNGFWGKRLSKEERDGYEIALNHLNSAINNPKEWI